MTNLLIKHERAIRDSPKRDRVTFACDNVTTLSVSLDVELKSTKEATNHVC